MVSPSDLCLMVKVMAEGYVLSCTTHCNCSHALHTEIAPNCCAHCSQLLCPSVTLLKSLANLAVLLSITLLTVILIRHVTWAMLCLQPGCFAEYYFAYSDCYSACYMGNGVFTAWRPAAMGLVTVTLPLAYKCAHFLPPSHV